MDPEIPPPPVPTARDGPPLPPPPMTGWGPQPEDPRVRSAWTKTIIALVMAPLSVIACSILSIPALVLSIIALVEFRRIEEKPVHCTVLAIVALVISAFGILWLLAGAGFFAYMMASGNFP